MQHDPAQAPSEAWPLREFRAEDADAMVQLWQACGLTRPWNDARRDLVRKQSEQPELFLVGVDANDQPVASVMAGWDGHRGAVWYLAVHPQHQRRGWGRRLMAEAEARLQALGCPKLNLLVRDDNAAALGFYARLGYAMEPVRCLGRRLIAD